MNSIFVQTEQQNNQLKNEQFNSIESQTQSNYTNQMSQTSQLEDSPQKNQEKQILNLSQIIDNLKEENKLNLIFKIRYDEIKDQISDLNNENLKHKNEIDYLIEVINKLNFNKSNLLIEYKDCKELCYQQSSIMNENQTNVINNNINIESKLIEMNNYNEKLKNLLNNKDYQLELLNERLDNVSKKLEYSNKNQIELFNKQITLENHHIKKYQELINNKQYINSSLKEITKKNDTLNQEEIEIKINNLKIQLNNEIHSLLDKFTSIDTQFNKLNNQNIESIINHNLKEIQAITNIESNKLVMQFVLKENELKNELIDLFLSELIIQFSKYSLKKLNKFYEYIFEIKNTKNRKLNLKQNQLNCHLRFIKLQKDKSINSDLKQDNLYSYYYFYNKFSKFRQNENILQLELIKDNLWKEMSNQIDELTETKKLLKSKLNDALIKLNDSLKQLKSNQINYNRQLEQDKEEKQHLNTQMLDLQQIIKDSESEKYLNQYNYNTKLNLNHNQLQHFESTIKNLKKEIKEKDEAMLLQRIQYENQINELSKELDKNLNLNSKININESELKIKNNNLQQNNEELTKKLAEVKIQMSSIKLLMNDKSKRRDSQVNSPINSPECRLKQNNSNNQGIKDKYNQDSQLNTPQINKELLKLNINTKDQSNNI